MPLPNCVQILLPTRSPKTQPHTTNGRVSCETKIWILGQPVMDATKTWAPLSEEAGGQKPVLLKNPASTLVSKEQMLRSHTKKGLVNICPVSCTGHCRRQAVELGLSLVREWSLFVGSVISTKLWFPNIANSLRGKKSKSKQILSYPEWSRGLWVAQSQNGVHWHYGGRLFTPWFSAAGLCWVHTTGSTSLKEVTARRSQERQKSCCKSICIWKLI